MSFANRDEIRDASTDSSMKLKDFCGRNVSGQHDYGHSVSEEMPPCDVSKDKLDCCEYHLSLQKDDHDIRTKRVPDRPSSSRIETANQKAEQNGEAEHLESYSEVVPVSAEEVGIDEGNIDLPLNTREDEIPTSVLKIKSSYKFQRGRPTSSEFVDMKELRLKCADGKEETTEKKSQDTAGHTEDDQDEPLDISKFLKCLAPPPVQDRVQQVYMLHCSSTLPAPVESIKTPTQEYAFPMDGHLEMVRIRTYAEYPPDCPVFVTKLARDGFVFQSLCKAITCYFCRVSIPLEDLYKNEANPLQTHRALRPNCPLTQRSECGNVPFPKLEDYKEFNEQAKEMDEKVKEEIEKSKERVTANNVASTDIGSATATSRDSIRTRQTEYNNTDARSQHQYQVNVGVAMFSQSPAGHYISHQASMPSLQTDSAPMIQQPEETSAPSRHESQPARLPSQKARLTPQPTSSLPTTASHNNTTVTRSASAGNTTTSSNSSQNIGNGTQKQQNTNATATNNGEASGQPKEKKKLTYSDLGIFAEKPKRPDMAVMSKRVASFKGKWNMNYRQTPEMLADAGMYYAGYNDCGRCFFCGGGLKNWEQPDDPWIEHARWFPKCAYLRLCKGAMFIDIVQRKNKNKEEVTIKDIETEIALKSTENGATKSNGASNVVSNGTYRQGRHGTVGTVHGATADLSLDVLEAENEELKSVVTCKICMDEESSVVFLPCGHLVACTHCSIALKNCPLCRAEIKGSVKAHMS